MSGLDTRGVEDRQMGDGTQDLDGDGIADATAATVSKFHEFKVDHSFSPTPLPMSQSHMWDGKDHHASVRGVVPGYSGHIPNSVNTFGRTAFGGLSPEKTGHKNMGPQKGHETDAVVLGRVPADTTLHGFKEAKGGMMPGYAGLKPGAKDNIASSAFAGVPLSPPKAAPKQDDPNSFRAKAGGVLPGYTGFIPGAADKHGGSHYGGIVPTKFAQSGHAEKDHVENNAGKTTKSGYSGHVQGKRDTYGVSGLEAHYEEKINDMRTEKQLW